MNISFDTLSALPSTYIAIGGIGATLLAIYAITILIIFPLYVYVHRINKKTDRLAYFYPITNHFYTVICSMQFYMYVTISIAMVALVLFNCQYALSVIILSICFAYLVAVAVTSVQNILLFVLAFRRFMILFLPNFKKRISINPKNFKLAVNSLYLFFVIVQVVTKLVKLFCTTESVVNSGLLRKYGNDSTGQLDQENEEKKTDRFYGRYNNCSASCDSIYMRIYITGDLLVMLAAFLYAIMFIKIRRWNKIVGDPLNHPEKYIFYQTLLIVITKMLAVCILLLVTIQNGYDDDWAFGTFVLCDVLTTPFVIQVSYLLCNRANVDTILAIQFKKMRTWLVLLCGGELRPKRKRNVVKKLVRKKEEVKPAEPKTLSTKDTLKPVIIVIPSLSKRRDTIG